MSWVDAFAHRAHRAIDWLSDLARRGEQRRVRLVNREGGTSAEVSLTLAVVLGLLACVLFLPLALLLAGVAWLLGYRLRLE